MKYIYKITNNKNNKVYIGQTTNIHRRWKKHVYETKQGKDVGKSAIHDAMRFYGVKNFSITSLGLYENYNEMEQYYIKKYNTLIPNGYNIQKGGEEPPHRYGEDHHNSTYTQDIVNCIIDDLLSKKYTQKEISEKYHVNTQLITSINRGVTHRRPGIGYPIIKGSLYHFNDQEVEEIKYLLKNSTCTCVEIAKYYGVDTSAIKAINAGRNYYQSNIKYPIRNFRGSANSQSVEAILAKRSTEVIDTPPEM